MLGQCHQRSSSAPSHLGWKGHKKQEIESPVLSGLCVVEAKVV